MSDELIELMHQPATGKGLELADIDALMDMMHSTETSDPAMFYISVHRYEQVRHIYKPYLRLLRRRKITRRHHRAAYRRKTRGLAQ